MEWRTTEGERHGKSMVANYDSQPDEDHADGVSFRDGADNPVNRRVTHVTWRGTGTAAAITTGVIEEVATIGGADHAYSAVLLMVEVDGRLVRLALPPLEASQLSQTLAYKAGVADRRDKMAVRA